MSSTGNRSLVLESGLLVLRVGVRNYSEFFIYVQNEKGLLERKANGITESLP
jgi:hypothetical protein